MKYIIYMDIFFIVNLVMDSILLKLAAFYIKPQTTFVRCLAGGGAGSILTCLSMLLSYDNVLLHMLVSYIFIAMVMVFAAYGKCRFKQMLKRIGLLYFVTVILGGAMNLVYNYTYFGYIIQGIFSSVYSNPINLCRMIFFTAASYGIMRLLLFLFGKEKRESFIVWVRVVKNEKSVKIKGLIDSGNSLTDPYNGKLVHIAEYDVLQTILEGVDIYKEKYRLVPFNSLGNSNGLIEVIEFDEINIFEVKDGQIEENYVYQELRPAIGLYHNKLSSGGSFNMLLNKDVSIHREDFHEKVVKDLK